MQMNVRLIVRLANSRPGQSVRPKKPTKETNNKKTRTQNRKTYIDILIQASSSRGLWSGFEFLGPNCTLRCSENGNVLLFVQFKVSSMSKQYSSTDHKLCLMLMTIVFIYRGKNASFKPICSSPPHNKYKAIHAADDVVILTLAANTASSK